MPSLTEVKLPLPPGGFGLPYLGETLGMLKDPGTFLEQRFRRFGPIFKTRILGHPVVCLAGAPAMSFFLDERYFTRVGGSPAQLQRLLNAEAVPFIDGAVHRKRKRLLLQAFNRDALTAYLPTIERIIERYTVRWEQQGRFAWVPELRAMCFAIGDSLFTGADPGQDNEPVREIFERFADGALALPIPLPIARFGRALKARDRLLAYVDTAISAHQGAPRPDVLSRLLGARDEAGDALSNKEIRIELLHFFFAAYTGVYSALSYVALLLAQHPAVTARARDEVARAGETGPLTVEGIDRLPYLDQVCKEVRRFMRLVPTTFFATVKESFDFAGHHVPKGWKAIGCVGATLGDEALFANPGQFDPDRFSPERAEDRRHDNAYIPHGPGTPEGHRCGGEALATLLMKVFTIRMLRHHTWELLPQRLEPRLGQLFPSPLDGLQVTFHRLEVG